MNWGRRIYADRQWDQSGLLRDARRAKKNPDSLHRRCGDMQEFLRKFGDCYLASGWQLNAVYQNQVGKAGMIDLEGGLISRRLVPPAHCFSWRCREGNRATSRPGVQCRYSGCRCTHRRVTTLTSTRWRDAVYVGLAWLFRQITS